MLQLQNKRFNPKMSIPKKKRITMKLKTPNPLFEKWLVEFRDKAIEEESKMKYVFNKAIESLRRYPVPLENGRDCKILKGFGDKICQMLDEKLKQHKNQQYDHLNDTIIGHVHIDKESDEISKPKRRKILVKHCGQDNLPRTYKVSQNEGILLDKERNLVKSTDLSQDRKITNGHSTKDVESEVVCVNLSNTEVITRQKSCSSKLPVTHQIKDKTLQKHCSSSSGISSQEDDIILPPDTFDIILYVDTCETGGSSIDIHDDPILSKLRLLSVNYEVKSLKVGDYIWICRDRATKREFVLPYIIERKRMDDFSQSIKDGRYREQKFRLKKSGVQNITYLIEKYSNSQYVGLPVSTLYQAATNTAIQDGFCIKFTDSCKETAKYLANFSLLMIKMFKSKTVVSCAKENLREISSNDDLISLMSFKEFNQNSSKNKPLKVSDLFVKMLIQIKGMSVDRALAIVQEFPSPATLREAYKRNPGLKGEKLLAQIQFGDHKKTIGHALSKTVYQLFTLQTF